MLYLCCAMKSLAAVFVPVSGGVGAGPGRFDHLVEFVQGDSARSLMKGIEGIGIINVVANTKDADKGKGKNLQIMITHNDGAEYRFLAPPITDADGKNWGCSVTNGKGTSKCALHLHGYTSVRMRTTTPHLKRRE
jgi:hypothetical protein